jgi:hypothetical protein
MVPQFSSADAGKTGKHRVCLQPRQTSIARRDGMRDFGIGLVMPVPPALALGWGLLFVLFTGCQSGCEAQLHYQNADHEQKREAGDVTITWGT